MTSLRDAMNQLFETSFVRPSSGRGTASGWQGFPLNIYERDNDLVVEALLPGISPEDVDVSVDRGVLTIAATRHGWQAEDGKSSQQSWYLQEIHPGQFRRAMTLPYPVEADKAQATYTNGLLTLTLPKAEAARPKQIRITTEAQPQIEATQA
jgi:HSP20 family protein